MSKVHISSTCFFRISQTVGLPVPVLSSIATVNCQTFQGESTLHKVPSKNHLREVWWNLFALVPNSYTKYPWSLAARLETKSVAILVLAPTSGPIHNHSKKAILQNYVFTFPKIAWWGTVGLGKAAWLHFYITRTICLLVMCSDILNTAAIINIF